MASSSRARLLDSLRVPSARIVVSGKAAHAIRRTAAVLRGHSPRPCRPGTPTISPATSSSGSTATSASAATPSSSPTTTPPTPTDSAATTKGCLGYSNARARRRTFPGSTASSSTSASDRTIGPYALLRSNHLPPQNRCRTADVTIHASCATGLPACPLPRETSGPQMRGVVPGQLWGDNTANPGSPRHDLVRDAGRDGRRGPALDADADAPVYCPRGRAIGTWLGAVA